LLAHYELVRHHTQQNQPIEATCTTLN